MKVKRKPTILAQTKDDFVAELQLSIDEDIYDFTGHFPSFSILPGVTQIDWAVYYARTILDIKADFSGMDVVKFQQPITPQTIVNLTLKWNVQQSKLQFKYHFGDTVFSSGKIKLRLE